MLNACRQALKSSTGTSDVAAGSAFFCRCLSKFKNSVLRFVSDFFTSVRLLVGSVWAWVRVYVRDFKLSS